jgi:hypothetical protein
MVVARFQIEDFREQRLSIRNVRQQ